MRVTSDLKRKKEKDKTEEWINYSIRLFSCVAAWRSAHLHLLPFSHFIIPKKPQEFSIFNVLPRLLLLVGRSHLMKNINCLISKVSRFFFSFHFYLSLSLSLFFHVLFFPFVHRLHCTRCDGISSRKSFIDSFQRNRHHHVYSPLRVYQWT